VALRSAAPPDAAPPDAAPPDAAPPDAAPPDAAPRAIGRRNAGQRDAGLADVGRRDVGPSDAARPATGAQTVTGGEADAGAGPGADAGKDRGGDARAGAGKDGGKDAGKDAGKEWGGDPWAETILHASCVAHAGRALLIAGPAGAGKSALAMEMIGLGARLVADDRTVLSRLGGALAAAPPAAIAGLIEVRGIGLLRLPFAAGVPVAGLVDLTAAEAARLPPLRTTALLGVSVTLYRRVAGAHLAAALMACLAGARAEPGSLR